MESKPSRFPDSLVLIFAMIVVAHTATFFIPAGQFQRDGRKVIPGSYERIQAPNRPEIAEGGEAAEESKSAYESFKAVVEPGIRPLPKILKGLEARADIIFFVFLIGGVIAVLRRTGAIDALIGSAIRNLGSRPLLLTSGMLLLFAVGSSTIGMAEEYMPFIPILVAMCIAMKLDAMVAMGIVYIGAGVGYGTAALNPFTVQIAKNIAGQDIEVAMPFRVILMMVMIVVGIQHLMSYAGKIRLDPTRSLVADVDFSQGFDAPENVPLTGRRKSILALFGVMIVVFVLGSKYRDWYLHELSALFLGLAVLAVTIDRMSANNAAQAFCAGAAEMTTTALLIGFASTIEVVLTDAQVIDTIIHGIASALEGLSAEVAAVGMLGVQSFCNFLIPSGSGQAYVTMPIMAPLSELTGVGREGAIFAYQFGDGLTNMLVPTNALLMGMLALGRIPYQRWLTFIVPLMIKLYVVAIVALIFVVRMYPDQ